MSSSTPSHHPAQPQAATGRSRRPALAAYAAGALAVAWVGYGYLGHSTLALAVTALIGAFYAAGGLELRRFLQDNRQLAAALDALPEPALPAGPCLADWLQQLPATLRTPVRQRVEGERAGLPGPALTPYLVGLLVLLGMLGTFVGMVVTLNGAVQAMEGSTDLATIRAALAAPVKGLGLAFGTSVAGVAASAMLGLVSALARRERLQLGQRLDGCINTVLRVFSRAHQRDESFKALQQQSQALPALVDRLAALAEQMQQQQAQLGSQLAQQQHSLGQQLAQQQQALSQQLLAGQQAFHDQAQAAYTGLAQAVGQSLHTSLTDSARAAGETIAPVVQATLAGIAHETTALRQTLTDAVGQQLDGLATRFEHTVGGVSQGWTAALAQHSQQSQALSQQLEASLGRAAGAFEQQASGLLARVADSQQAQQAGLEATAGRLAEQAQALHGQVASALHSQLDGVAAHWGQAVEAVSSRWAQALAEHERSSQQVSSGLHTALQALAPSFAQHSQALLASLAQAQATQQAALAAQDEQRQAALAVQLRGLGAELQQQWQQAGAQQLAQQQQVCATLEATAAQISQQAQAQAQQTITQITALLDTAAQAPRAAAEVMAALREQLSSSLVRDNALLEERSRIMDTLGTLLDAVKQAATAQRGAIDALVGSSAELLQRVGQQFSAQVDAGSQRLDGVAEQLAGGAQQMGQLAEAFGGGVQQFSSAGAQLVAQLQAIEATLGQQATRSDEQLAYYVAQAREVIDLSILSQKQIIDELQQLAGRSAAAAAVAGEPV